MLKDKTKLIHLIYGCILSALLVAVGIAFIVSCLDIYNSGNKPYTPESVAAHFQRISLLVYITIAFIIGGIILDLALPQEKKRPKAIRDEAEALARLNHKAGTLEGSFFTQAQKERTLRLSLKIGTGAVCALLTIRPLVYFLDQSNFIGEKTDCILKAMTIALIYAGICLALTFLCKMLCSKSIGREIDICKNAIAQSACTPNDATHDDERKEARRILIVRSVIAVLAIVFIVLGIFNGGAEAVLRKANAICMECIGMG